MKYVIPIHGEIGKDLKASNIMLHLTNAKDYDSIHLDVNSIGGEIFEADKIIKLLVDSGKVHTAANSGDVMSAAVDIFMTAPVRSFDPTKGGFLIHNPWNDTKGDASDHEAVAKELKRIETDLAKKFAKITGVEESIIKMLMSEDRPLTVEEIKTYNFATIVERITPVPLAIYKPKTNTMTDHEIDKKLESFGKKLTDSFKSMFKPKAMMIADADGNEITIPDIADISELAVGLAVTGVNDGTYTLTDGRILTIEAGVITVIDVPVDEMAELKAENERLKAELEAKAQEITAIAEEKTKAMAKFTELQNDFNSIKSSFKPKAEKRKDENENQPQKFNYKKK